MKILLTGGSGMIGMHLVAALQERGHAVRCLVRDPERAPHLRELPVEVVRGDLGDPSSLRDAVRATDAVIHTAGAVSYWERRAAELRRVNVEGTRALLDAAVSAGVRRFVFTSSIATLGYVTDGRPGDERTAYNWHGARIAYFDTKAEAETLVLRESRLEGVAVNPGITFGTHDVNVNAARMLLSVANGGPLGFPPGATTVATIEDVVAGHLAALQLGKPGERYVLGGHLVTFEELYARIGAVVGRVSPRRRLSPFTLRTLGRMAVLRSAITGKEPEVTPQLAEITSRDRRYLSQRAENELGYRISPLEPCLTQAWAWIRERA